MNFQLDEIVSQFSWYLLPLFRIAGFIMVAPIFSSSFISPRVRLGMVIAFSLTVIPTLSPNLHFDPVSFAGGIMVLQQLIIGVAIGFVMQVIFAAIVNAGQLVGMQMGLGFAQMMDPQNGVSVPVISQFYNILGVLLFLVMNGHLVMIRILADSFSILPVGAGGLPSSALVNIVYFGSWIFSGAVIMALPAVMALLMISVVMGVITKSTPQMNIFAVGFAITIIAGFIIMLVTLSTAFPQMANLFGEGFKLMRETLSHG